MKRILKLLETYEDEEIVMNEKIRQFTDKLYQTDDKFLLA